MIATRGQLLGLVLVTVLAYGAWLTLYPPHPAERVRVPIAPPDQTLPEISHTAPAGSSLLGRLGRRPRGADPEVDLFGARTWSALPRVKPGVPVAAAVAPVVQAPVAPPALPFKYMGRLVSGDERMLFVAWGERNLVLREADVVEAVYRLDRIGEVEATFSHLGAGVQLQLPFLLDQITAAREAGGDVAAAVSPVPGEPSPAAAAGAGSTRGLGGVHARGQPASLVRANATEASAALASEAAAAALARRARALRAIPVEPWVCTAQQANELRECELSPPVEGASACKQAAASRYRACLGGALRSAQRPAPDEDE